ncbi:MAG: hypothetical protein JRI73_07400 [Deltaproteobacteria bacterium]|nr:hypothetical protein [Deltaproteobacteria bacterium]
MELQLIEKSGHDLFVQNLINKYQVEGVKPKDGSFIYGPIKAPEELCLDFDCTLISPKKYFLPPKEALLKFGLISDSKVTPLIDNDPFILFGVHPYDIKAINQMDRIFSPLPETERGCPSHRCGPDSGCTTILLG